MVKYTVKYNIFLNFFFTLINLTRFLCEKMLFKWNLCLYTPWPWRHRCLDRMGTPTLLSDHNKKCFQKWKLSKFWKASEFWKFCYTRDFILFISNTIGSKSSYIAEVKGNSKVSFWFLTRHRDQSIHKSVSVFLWRSAQRGRKLCPQVVSSTEGRPDWTRNFGPV